MLCGQKDLIIRDASMSIFHTPRMPFVVKNSKQIDRSMNQ